MVALFAQQSNIVEFPTKSNEWYTPARYVEAAREVMGGIDLDPASCKEANMVVRASKFYTIKDNGIEQPWFGRVWLNPPYSKVDNKSNIGTFTKKLIEEYESGNVTQALLLATIKSDTPWFMPLWNYPICFADHRLHFYKPNIHNVPIKDSRTSHTWGTIFVYLGPHEQKFINTFQQFGTVARRVSVPKVQPTNLSLWEVN